LKKSFNLFLKEKIAEYGLSPSRVSKLTGISQAMLSKTLKGERRLSAANLVKLAPLIGMKETEILEAAGLLSQSEETLKKKVFDPDYQPNEIDLEDLLRVGNVTMFGERLEEKDKEAILKIARLVWDERRRIRQDKGI
jgi:transcriptional regulator with XRE-family HTH domain